MRLTHFIHSRNFRFGSFADPHDTPKAAARAAGIDGIVDLAIHGKQPFVSGKFWDQNENSERKVLADNPLCIRVPRSSRINPKSAGISGQFRLRVTELCPEVQQWFLVIKI